MPEGSPFLKLPDIGKAYYIISFWQDCGSVVQGSNGLLPLSWQEIQAWRQENNIQLTSFEVGLMRKLSIVYVNAHYEASKKDSLPPWVGKEYDKAAAGKSIMNTLRSLNKNNGAPKYTTEN